MTRKDFEMIALVLKTNRATQQMIGAFADKLACTNANFNRTVFVLAAGGMA